jgi:signal transduction histidine kinase
VTVRDTGPGIPSEVRQQIFTPFFTTKARGTGLGLPTAKRIIEAHSGSIAVECPAGGGTAVTIDLPIAGISV